MQPDDGCRNPKHHQPTWAAWAQRAIKAHSNAVENLVVFAALVLVVEVSGAGNALTSIAVLAYFWLRVVHYVVYIIAVPWLRTPIYLASWACEMALAYVLLAG
jgi:uncharacterized MAPEG superfamily protein